MLDENELTVRPAGPPDGAICTFTLSPATIDAVPLLVQVVAASLMVQVLAVAVPFTITVNA